MPFIRMEPGGRFLLPHFQFSLFDLSNCSSKITRRTKTNQVLGLKPVLCDPESQPMISEPSKKSTENILRSLQMMSFAGLGRVSW